MEAAGKSLAFLPARCFFGLLSCQSSGFGVASSGRGLHRLPCNAAGFSSVIFSSLSQGVECCVSMVVALFRGALLMNAFWHGFALILEHLVKIDYGYLRSLCRLMESPGFVVDVVGDAHREKRVGDAPCEKRVDDALREKRVDDALREKRVDDALREKRVIDAPRERRVIDAPRERRVT